MKTKLCCTCKKLKDVNDFNVDSNNSDGLCVMCKSCKSTKNIAYNHSIKGLISLCRSSKLKSFTTPITLQTPPLLISLPIGLSQFIFLTKNF